MLYGDVFEKIAIAALVSAAVCFALVPLLKRWTHPEIPAGADDGPRAGDEKTTA
jgi:hypothetical protein